MLVDLTLLILALLPPLPVLLVPALPGLLAGRVSPATLRRLYRGRWAAFAVGAAACALLAVRLATGRVSPPLFAVAVAGFAALCVGFLLAYPPHLFRPVRELTYVDVREADRLLDPEDEVVGILDDDLPRAYPVTTMLRPHAVVDRLGEHPLTVTLCSLSGTAAAFTGELAPGRGLDLRTVTAVDDNVVFYDGCSGNLIQQLGERVVDGPDRGRQLEARPAATVPWATWRRLYPHTRLGHRPARGPLDRLLRAAMLRVHRALGAAASPFYRVRRPLDPRLPPMTRMLGVARHGEARAYPCDLFAGRVVVDTTLGGEPVTLWVDAGAGMSAVYSRRSGGRVLSFAADGGAAFARDRESTSRWSLAGEAVSGAEAGTRLEPVHHYWGVFWFRWALTYPETGLAEALAGVAPA